MDRLNVSDKIDEGRRRLIGAAAMGTVIAELDFVSPVKAASGGANEAAAPSVKVALAEFGPLKQVDAGVLSVSYAELGPADGPPVILLHGWPYDIHTYVDVASILASKRYRVIVPHLRGYGTTRFLSDDTMRNGQQSAIAGDIIAVMDALRIEKATIGGCDWAS